MAATTVLALYNTSPYAEWWEGEAAAITPALLSTAWLASGGQEAKLTVGRTEMAAATVACCHGLCRDGPQQQCLATPGKVCPCSVSIFFLNMSSWRHEQLL